MTIYSKGISSSTLTPTTTDEGFAEVSRKPTPSKSDDSSLKKDSLNLQQLENSKKNTEEWNSDITGQWGTHWDAVSATNLQSDTPWVNSLLRGVNNTVGTGAVFVNYINMVGGRLFFDIPSMIESKVVENGGPSFDELAVTSQASTPGMPIDDAAFLTVAKLGDLSRQVHRLHKLRKLNLDKLRVSDKVVDLIDMELSREAKFSPAQLQSKFKHAPDFGIKGNYNKGNIEKFRKTLINHINDPDVIPIRGTHRKTQPVLHFYNPNTELNVMLKTDKNFISCWKLGEGQIFDLLKTGNIQ